MSFTSRNSAVISTRDVALPAPAAAALRILPTLLTAIVLTIVTVVALAPSPAGHRAGIPPAAPPAAPVTAVVAPPEVVLILAGPETSDEVLSDLNVVNFGYSPDHKVVVLTLDNASDEGLAVETMREMMQAGISVHLVDLRGP